MKKTRIYIMTVLAVMACAAMLLTGAAFAQEAETAAASESLLDTSSMFTARDKEQSPNVSKAERFTVADNEDINITAEGIYLISGTASNVTIYVEAEDTEKIQLVLDGLNIENDCFPCIYVKGADKVFVTTIADSSLSVIGKFISDGPTNTDGVIFSKTDLVLNGTHTLTVSSTDVGIVCKDDLKITGGTYNVTSQTKALEAKDSIRILDGTFTIDAGSDGMHAENSNNDAKGFIYISGGDFSIKATDDAIHATSIIQIDGGTFNIDASEGLEATCIQINDGDIFIKGRDDGMNAGRKSNTYSPSVEINGGTLTMEIGVGDTDGIDSNGDIIINGGVVSVTAGSAFDCDGEAVYTGGTIIVNGEELDYIPITSRMGDQ